MKTTRPSAKGGAVARTSSAHQIGARAYAALHESDKAWTVLASVSGAIYIESDVEEVLWIAARSSALHQRAVLLPIMPAELPAVGTECIADDDCLHIGDKLVIKHCDAAVWSSDLVTREGACALESPRRIAEAIDQVALRSTPQGVLARIGFPNSAAGTPGLRETMGVELAAVARRAVASLYRVSFACDLPKKLQAATGLVGLGEGLTPSGDDLLGAFLFTLSALDSAHRGGIGIDWQHVGAWLRRVKPLTNKISFAVLADHAHGDAAAPLCALLGSALDGSSTESLVRLAGRVTEIGHSSGWDMLVGIHCACSVVARMLEHASEAGISQCVAAGPYELSRQSKHWKEVVRVC